MEWFCALCYFLVSLQRICPCNSQVLRMIEYNSGTISDHYCDSYAEALDAYAKDTALPLGLTE
jgi:hypothetical protein